MAAPTPVRGLFETHLTVADVGRSTGFYRDVVGLPVALDLTMLDAAPRPAAGILPYSRWTG